MEKIFKPSPINYLFNYLKSYSSPSTVLTASALKGRGASTVLFWKITEMPLKPVHEVARELDMYNKCDDEGLTDEIFRAYIDEFIWDNFSEEESDRLYNLPYYEKVKIILNKL